MTLQTVERWVWTVAVGGFLAYLLGALLAPNPTRIHPYVVGASVAGLPIAHWYVGGEVAGFPSDGAGRLTLFFLTMFVVAYLGMEAVGVVAGPDSAAGTVGRAGSVLVGIRLGRRAADRAGYDRIRATLGGESGRSGNV
ncbi:hypothetical protein [Halorussus pelagicus]|uniref:hypothetical protein n=1 Tax=Halorussus pelagicus TaxID=2505977 RepID=UPI000FFB2CF0|nr:hypothetical protein [Halorussus pelagicus]